MVGHAAGGQSEGPRACIHPYKAELNSASGRWELFGPSGVNIYEPGFATVEDAEIYAKRCIRYDNE